jgi:hypothetical protein
VTRYGLGVTERKELEMLYSCRMDYLDGTFAVSTFPASSYSEAVALCKRDLSVASVTVLGTIDQQPQVFLAW